MSKFELENEDAKCAPSKHYIDGSCFTLNKLIKIAHSYNHFYPGNKINIIESKKYLVNEIRKRATECDDQLCWLNLKWIQNLNDDDINKNTFRPKGPQGRFKWLSTTNINEIVEQYEHKYQDFKFLGATPYDFADHPELGISNLNLDHFCKKYNKFGMIINFDNYNQPGSHWVALYANIKNNKIYYFDSYGTRPKKRICDFVKKIALWCYNHNIDPTNHINDTDESFMTNEKNKYEKLMDIQYSNIRHQYKDSECGVYSVNFILRLLHNESFDLICSRIIDDDTINQFRKVYFRFK